VSKLTTLLLPPPRRAEVREIRLMELLKEMGLATDALSGRLVVLLNGRTVAKKKLGKVVVGEKDTLALLRPVVGG